MRDPLRFTITTHPHLPGVGLSLLGHWGGIRYPDDARAEAEARRHADDAPLTIKRVTVRRHAVR